MPKVISDAVIWSAKQNIYVQRSQGSLDLQPITGEQEQWFSWLAVRSAFAFQGQQGHLTLRKEARARKEEYWYAFRCQNRRTIKRYVGRTADLTLARLEEIATEIAAAFARAQKEAQEAVYEPQESSSGSLLLMPKLRLPHLHSSLIVRERLMQRLDAALEGKLTVLCAPAGFGKTILVRQWIASRSECNLLPSVAWVSLDASDNDPLRFWRYVLTACQGWYNRQDQHLLDLLSCSIQPSIAQSARKSLGLENVLTSFLNELSQQNISGLLVLEDYHLIAEARIHETLNFLLAHMPETLHIVLITRYEPPLSLVRLRANGDLHEISASDLRFSFEETTTFLQEFALSVETLQRLNTHLEGWAAGLRLLLLSLQRKTTQAQIEQLLASFSGTHRPVLDYFVTEVLEAQTERLQEFLLRTSVLARLSPALCAAVSGMQESAELLRQIERANLFLDALDDVGEWYRYHALFAQAMQHEARRRLGEREFQALLYMASTWFEQQGMLAEAIETALKMAEGGERAAALIEQFVSREHFYETPEYHTLRRWLEQIPDKWLKQSPLLCLNYAGALLFTQEEEPQDQKIYKQNEELLQRAEESWRASANFPRLGEVFALRAFYTFHRGKYDLAIEYAQQALSWLPEDAALWRGLTLSIVGINAFLRGHLNEARFVIEEVYRLWKTGGNPYTRQVGVLFLLSILCFEQGEMHLALRYCRKLEAIASSSDVSFMLQICQAQIYYEWNDLEVLQQLAQAGRPEGQVGDFPDEIIEILSESVLARIAQIRGETQQAVELVGNIVSRLRSFPEEAFLFSHEALCWLVQLSLLRGDLDTAQCWLNELVRLHKSVLHLPDREYLQAPEDPDALDQVRPPEVAPVQVGPLSVPVLQEQRALLMARMSLARGEFADALAILNYVLPNAKKNGRGRHTLQTKLLLAQVYAACSQLPQAYQFLIAALEQAYPQGMQRIFLDEGPALYSLMSQLLPQLEKRPLRDYLRRLLQTFAQTQAGQKTIVTPALNEPLSAQEQRVLRLLVAGYSNAEIARELVVSVNTIRTQVQSIYRKLDVHDRKATGEIARHLRLV
ncbi:hypothetical protein EPA93_13570 [Ktedonosporobacter rubrisoli]|uniref:HTH luxR-type domain-containing protein n=1 Tax=Ktedonosporobacter rubrisoli TaxID=2509675 RepID=A0A4P6JQD7_KTERU|nr:LuxR C-terminal-related transcriptional regulator [Ktedonosporobacter rubrisoli]QBD76976.1 hypothetical protein EPA93_13570 [Ktedonosporobacter rubrisoli]